MKIDTVRSGKTIQKLHAERKRGNEKIYKKQQQQQETKPQKYNEWLETYEERKCDK